MAATSSRNVHGTVRSSFAVGTGGFGLLLSFSTKIGVLVGVVVVAIGLDLKCTASLGRRGGHILGGRRWWWRGQKRMTLTGCRRR